MMIAMLLITIYSAVMLRFHTHDVVTEEVNRRMQIIPLEQWREFQESMK